jgi:hypothetical protein
LKENTTRREGIGEGERENKGHGVVLRQRSKFKSRATTESVTSTCRVWQSRSSSEIRFGKRRPKNGKKAKRKRSRSRRIFHCKNSTGRAPMGWLVHTPGVCLVSRSTNGELGAKRGGEGFELFLRPLPTKKKKTQEGTGHTVCSWYSSRCLRVIEGRATRRGLSWSLPGSLLCRVRASRSL